MDKEKIKKLVGVTDFDTARNVYFVLATAEELKRNPLDLVDNVHQIKGMQIERKASKLLFEALVDCSSLEEQVTLIKLLFDSFDGDIITALSTALNSLEDGLY